MTVTAGELSQAAAPRAPRRRFRRPELMAAPGFGYLLVLYFVPLAVILVSSITSPHLGVQNFQQSLTSTNLRLLADTIVLAAVSTLVALVVGYPLAYTIAAGPRWLRRPLIVCVIAPFMTSVIVRTFGWEVLLARTGIIGRIAGDLTGNHAGLLQTRAAVIIGLVQIVLPVVVLPIVSAMRKVDANVLRSGHSLGAGHAYVFTRVYLPLTVPGVQAGCILGFVFAVGSFITPAVLGGYGTTGSMLGSQIELITSQYADWGTASAMAVEMTLVVLVVVAVYRWVMGGRVEWLVVRSTGAARQRRRRPLSPRRLTAGPWSADLIGKLARFADSRRRQPPYAAIGLAVSIAVAAFLVLPQLIAIPVSFTKVQALVFPPAGLSLNWYREFFTSAWLDPLVLSLIIAASAAIVAPALALLTAMAVERSRYRALRNLANVLMLTPAVVPTVVAAVGYYLAFVRVNLVDTAQGLILAETCLAMPFAYVVLAEAVRALDPSYERAASSLGARRSVVLRQIVLRLVAPALLTAMLFSFLLAFDESAVSIFLSGLNVQTLPAQMFAALTQQSDPTVGVVGALSQFVALAVLGCFGIAAAVRRLGRRHPQRMKTAVPPNG